MDLRFNKASVNSALDVWGVTNNKIFKWFNYGGEYMDEG